MKLSFLSIRRICVEHLGIFTETGRGTAGGGGGVRFYDWFKTRLTKDRIAPFPYILFPYYYYA